MTHKSEPIVLDDGMVPVRVMRDGKEVTYKIDLLRLQLASQGCVKRHNLNVLPSGLYEMTEEFIEALAVKFASLGIEGCTCGEAAQIWAKAFELTDDLQKKTNETQNSPTGSTSTPRPKRGRKK